MIDFLTDFINEFLDLVIDLLPKSPFQGFIHAFEELPYLSYLNWFFPVDTCLAIGEAWLIAIGLFYLYSVIARWLRVIQ